MTPALNMTAETESYEMNCDLKSKYNREQERNETQTARTFTGSSKTQTGKIFFSTFSDQGPEIFFLMILF